MYDLQYVRKRRRRRIAALVSLFASIGITALVIISFLGRTVGTFTVAIKNTTVQLALSEKESFEHRTSYLRIDNIPSSYYEYSYKWFDRVGLNNVDDENNDYFFGMSGDGQGMYFLKYTFYVKNVGTTTAQYNMYINLTDSTKSVDGKTLDDTLRIMVFENDPSVPDSHEKKVYAKDVGTYRYDVYDKEGNPTKRAFVADAPEPVPVDDSNSRYAIYEDDEHPLVDESFRSSSAVIQKTVTDFEKNEMMRYTVVYWLEGEASFPEYDENGNFKEPKGAKIKLSIDITASSYNSKQWVFHI